jgi:hypothetical protein
VKSLVPMEVHSSKLVESNQWVPRGSPCLGHVALFHIPSTATCQHTIRPSACPIITTCPVTVYHVSYRCAMCHPCSGDTCHSQIGPHVHATSASCPHHQYVHPFTLPHVTSRCFHVRANYSCHIICTVVHLVQSASTWH